MGKKSKRRTKASSGRGSTNSRVPTPSIQDLTGPMAALYLDPNGYNERLGCTNSEALEKIEALQNKYRSKASPNTEPQTPEQWREWMNFLMDHFERVRLTAEDPLHEPRLMCFLKYAHELDMNIVGGICARDPMKCKDVQPNLPEQKFPVTDDDKKFLYKILEENDSPVYVSCAHWMLGKLYICIKCDADKGFFHIQSSINECDSVSTRDKGQKITCLDPIIHDNGKTRAFNSVGDYLDFVRENAQRLTNRANRFFMNQKGGGNGLPGEQCDGCGQTKDSLNKPSLLVCKRCQRTYYCSKECQLAHWKQKPQGHRQTCRKNNEFRQGDEVKTLEQFSKTPANSCVFLLEKKSDKEWLVSNHFGDKGVLPEKQLRVLSPFEKRLNVPSNKTLSALNLVHVADDGAGPRVSSTASSNKKDPAPPVAAAAQAAANATIPKVDPSKSGAV